MEDLKRGLQDTNAIVAKLNDEVSACYYSLTGIYSPSLLCGNCQVQGITAGMLKLKATVESMNEATVQLRNEQQKMKGEIVSSPQSTTRLSARQEQLEQGSPILTLPPVYL